MEGLIYILGHFPEDEPVWPRTISTKVTEGRQLLVYNTEETLARFEQATFLDCRINAYRFRDDWALKLLGQAPDFLFIDEDESNFESRELLDRCHKRTLKTVESKLNGGHPTVLWSGNGYHILQPIKAFALESEEVFTSFENPSMQFLRFAEPFLSNNKADPCHSNSLSFKNCMLRIPGSYNSKLLQYHSDTGESPLDDAEVKILQRWDGVRPAINWLLRDFRRYLIQKKMDLLIEKRKAEVSMRKSGYKYSGNSVPVSKYKNDIIPWIEVLLRTGLPDHRKYALSLIVVPYVVNVRRLPYNEAVISVKNWLAICNSLRKLDYGFDYRIKYALRNSQKNGFRAIGLEKLKRHNVNLYKMMETTLSSSQCAEKT